MNFKTRGKRIQFNSYKVLYIRFIRIKSFDTLSECNSIKRDFLYQKYILLKREKPKALEVSLGALKGKRKSPKRKKEKEKIFSLSPPPQFWAFSSPEKSLYFPPSEISADFNLNYNPRNTGDFWWREMPLRRIFFLHQTLNLFFSFFLVEPYLLKFMGLRWSLSLPFQYGRKCIAWKSQLKLWCAKVIYCT